VLTLGIQYPAIGKIDQEIRNIATSIHAAVKAKLPQ
jgi:hypothetical protein